MEKNYYNWISYLSLFIGVVLGVLAFAPGLLVKPMIVEIAKYIASSVGVVTFFGLYFVFSFFYTRKRDIMLKIEMDNAKIKGGGGSGEREEVIRKRDEV